MKTNSITHKHFDELVKVIVKEFPATKVYTNTPATYRVYNSDFMLWVSVNFETFSNGTIALMVSIPGIRDCVWAHTSKEFKRVKKQLVAACRKFR